jgi:hypothetical protein
MGGDAGYTQALEAQERGQIKIARHARVRRGNLFYDAPEHDREEY